MLQPITPPPTITTWALEGRSAVRLTSDASVLKRAPCG